MPLASMHAERLWARTPPASQALVLPLSPLAVALKKPNASLHPPSTSQFERAMPDRNADVRQVAIRRHIEDGRRRIALIRGLIAQVASRGGDTTLGDGLLASMEGALDTLMEIGRANGGEICAVNAEPLRSSSTVEARRAGLAAESFDPVVAHCHGRDGQPRHAKRPPVEACLSWLHGDAIVTSSLSQARSGRSDRLEESALGR